MKTIANFNRVTTWTVGLVTAAGAAILQDSAIHTVGGLLARAGYDGFTVLPGIGYWKGRQEPCLVFTLYSDDKGVMTLSQAKAVAAAIAKLLMQECVLVSHASRETPVAYLVEP